MTATAPNTYLPALKGKAGEMKTLKNTSAEQRRSMIPVVDLPPIENRRDETVVAEAIGKFSTAFRQSYDATNHVIVDATATDGVQIKGREAIATLHDQLRSGIAGVPVVRLTSSTDYIAAAAVIAAADGYGVCIRLAPGDFANTTVLAPTVDGVVSALNVAPDAIDIVLDLGFVGADTVGRLAGFVPDLVGALPHLAEWRSVVLLSGAFPESLAGLKADEPRRFTRHDAELWNKVAAAGPTRIPQYGDYATTHPVLPSTQGWRSAPNVRYTTGDEWYALRSKLDSEEGHRTFFGVCEKLRNETPAIMEASSFSWGDRELHRCADGTGGPGGGTDWKAWSTSHHLAAVITNLATTGAP